MPAKFFPDADVSVVHRPKSATQDSRYPPRGVLHTTETPSLPSYESPSAPPHFTVMPSGVAYQHMSVDVVSGALRNVYPGHDDARYDTGIDPDRTGVINVQIEVVGYSRQSEWPDAQVTSIAKIMGWLEQEWHLPAEFRATFGGGEQYGYVNPFELTLGQWLKVHGWVGHQHVPENTHWDPGKYLPALVDEKLKELRNVGVLRDIGERVGIDTIFAKVWNRLRGWGVYSEYTDPDVAFTAERLAAIIDRYDAERVQPLWEYVKALDDEVGEIELGDGVDQLARTDIARIKAGLRTAAGE